MMEHNAGINSEPAARSDVTVMERTVDESSLTKTLSNAFTPEMTTAELAPLQSVKTHTVTTVEVTKDSTNVDMDETLSNAAYPVYVKSLTEAEDVLHQFENDTKTRYSVWRCPKDFGSSQIDVTNKRIYWQEFDIGDKITVKSDGVPFIMMGRKVYDCHFGKDRNIKLKERMRLQREEVLKSDATKTRKTPLTKKIDCPAKIVFCEIIYFPDFKICNNTKYRRGVVAKKIKESFAAGSVNLGNIERRIYISFPTSEEHSGHPSCVQGTNLSHRVDPKISKKLSELVLSGVRNDNEMREQLQVYTGRDLFPGKAKPFHCNKRYFPSMSVIRIKMYNECILQRLMVLDCDQIEELVGQVKINDPDDKIYTRRFEGMNEVLAQGTFSPSHEELLDDEVRVRQKFSQQQMIFVHQTSFQRHLLKRYGNHVCFLDPVYRTVKYPLPLFFVMVKTNVDYQAVATFVVQDENKESTKEALEFIKSWNPDWKPKVFMVDNDIEEIACVDECFPDSRVLVSDFHREQSWQHWLSQSCNGVVAHKNAILVYLRRIADAKTEQEFHEALKLLEKADIWQCNYGEMFREWFGNKWLNMKERWVYANKKTLLSDLVMTNFTVEHQKFSHEELLDQGGTVLSDVLERIIKIILPAKRDFYMEQNGGNSSEEPCNVPSFYCRRPRDLAEHTAKCMSCVNEFTSNDIFEKGPERGVFYVKSSHSDDKYKVNFGNEVELPRCECEDWFKTMMPCQHFLVVMQHYKNWNWTSFPEHYQNSPYLTQDPIIDENSNEDPTTTQSDPSDSRQGTSQFRTDPSPSRLDTISNQTDLSGSRPIPNVSRPESVDANVIPAVCLDDVLLDKKSGLKSAATDCRHLLNDINNMTYLIQDKRVLTLLHGMLQKTLDNLKQSAVDDDVVSLSFSEATKTECKKNEVYPMKGRKRAGDWSDLGSSPSKSSKMNENETSSKSETSQHAIKCNDGHYQTMNGNAGTPGGANFNTGTYGDTTGDVNGNRDTSGGTNLVIPSGEVKDIGISMNTSDANSKMSDDRNINIGQTIITVGTNSHVIACENTVDPHGSSVNLDDPPPLNTSKSSESQNEMTGLNFSEFENKKDDDVTVLYSNAVGSLSKHEEKLLMKQEAVTHSTVNLAQGLLQEAFQRLGGLQTVARGPVQAFEHVSGDFIQILHDGCNHWVCASNKVLDVKDRAAVNMYDSMNQGFIAKFTKQQLASFMCIQSAEMKVIMKSVQQHTSPVDCGVFAIAFATALAFGQDPSKLRFDVPKMRPHLVECLKVKKMSPFPEIKSGCGSDIVLSKRKFYTVELFCSCRMPYEKPKSEADLMAQCSVCDEWFHQKCDHLKAPGHNFVCRACARKV